MVKFGFLRESQEQADKAGADKDTGLIRTGLDTYLSAIFPGAEWIHDKPIKDAEGNSVYVGDKLLRNRPDYRCESLKMIVEFDGIPHYTKPDVIHRDYETTEVYTQLGYTVIRIPYFIQLTNKAIKTLFNVDVTEPMFPEEYPSIGPYGQNSPAYVCYAGLLRMAREFLRFPEQLRTNLTALLDAEESHPELSHLCGTGLLLDMCDTILSDACDGCRHEFEFLAEYMERFLQTSEE